MVCNGLRCFQKPKIAEKCPVLSQRVAGPIGVLLYDVGIAHTPSQHNLGALLNGSQHTYACRVYGKGTKPYWYHNTDH